MTPEPTVEPAKHKDCTHGEIALLAYRMWETREDGTTGDADSDWYAAERELEAANDSGG
jgi:hypothetical protein